MNEFRICQLASGFWCVWRGDEWLNASLPSKEAAEEYVRQQVKSMKRRER